MTKKKRKQKKKLQMYNKRLIKKYYWLMPRDWRGRPIKDYDYTWIEWGWGPGWNKAFGQMYMDELGAAIKESGQKDFIILDIKEKYGQGRLYCGGASSKVHEIIHKYEFISECICFWCGCEAPMVDTGWILPECYKCYTKQCRKHGSQKTDQEILEDYKKHVCDAPDENGEWHIPHSYTVRRYSKDGDVDEVFDISETVEKIRKRQEKWIRR